MSQMIEAQHFCKDNNLPSESGWVLFTIAGDLTKTDVPFGWCLTLPHLFQPFRLTAINLQTDERVKAVGLGARQRWESIQ